MNGDLSGDLSTLHGNELDTALARHFTVASETVVVGETSYVLHKPENADHLISEQDYVMDERLPYWADLWPSSLTLAATLLTQHGNGRRLLEMGCGLGLATVAAMDAGFSVLATDYYEDAIHMTRANAWRNLGREPDVRLVNWRYWPEDLGLFDVIIAADVLYETEYALLVAECIATALAPDGTAIIVDPGRTALPTFKTHLMEVGLYIASTTLREHNVTPTVAQQIQVMSISRRSAVQDQEAAAG